MDTWKRHNKYFEPVEIKNTKTLNSQIFKRVEEIAKQMKRNTKVVFTSDYQYAHKYGEHLVKEETSYFPY